jgi:choline dehydrogenase-like flavoprotein
MLTAGLAGLATAGHDLCVVGSGPVGLALATDLARRGVRVLLLESGGETADAHVQTLSQADLKDPARHDDMSVAAARRLGGTSNLWGARCIPYEPIDFAERPYVDARWPIAYRDLEPWIGPAVAATRSGAADYLAPRPLAPGAGADFSADSLERWANIQAAQVVHAETIAKEPRLDLRTHATVVGLDLAGDGRVQAIEVAHTLTGERVRLPIDTLVIAAGGLESTRLLLAARRHAPALFGGEDGPLGRHYMGHVIGEIADIVLASGDIARAFDFTVDGHGSYVRRRITPSAQAQMEHQLLNSAFWPVVPPVADPRHGNAILSLVFLALSYGPLGRRLVAEAIRRRHIPARPTGHLRHLGNVATGIPSALLFSADFLRRRYDKRTRLPGFFIRNRANRYGLSYHAEQAPRPESRVWLSGAQDRLGLPSLAIDYRFCRQDADSVVRTHDLMEGWLKTSGLGRIEYRVPREDRVDAVLAQAAHGTHQIGLARMGAHRREGVVDADLKCFDSPNLYVASTAVLPTSGQANPTLTTVALALRLSERLAQARGRGAPATASAAMAI